MESEVAMNIVSRYGDDFYGCLEPTGEMPPADFGGGGGTPLHDDSEGGGTPQPPMAQDCSDIRAQYFKKCGDMAAYYVNLNCEKNDYYSGCALDVAGCMDILINSAFSDNRCGEPGYLGCARGQADTYLGCLKSCNARFVERQLNQSLTDCRVACQSSFEAGLQECESWGR
jgi:hypothetical protein